MEHEWADTYRITQLDAFMRWIEIIVLAVVQGLTEFIPVSSTAHLKIVPALFHWPDPARRSRP